MDKFFDFSHDEPFEIGAKLIAVLGFPGSQEADYRQRAFEALCAQTVHETCASDPDHSASWRAKFPDYAAVGEREIRRRLRTLRRRLRDRMTAARMALGYFDEAMRHMFVAIGKTYPDLRPKIGHVALRPTPLPNGVIRHSLNALSQFHFPHDNEDGRHNREQRIWRASLPVIHLAVAFHVLGRHFQPKGGTFDYKLDDPDLHRRILALVETHETALQWEWRLRQAGLEGSSHFVINPGLLIRFQTKIANSDFF